METTIKQENISTDQFSDITALQQAAEYWSFHRRVQFSARMSFVAGCGIVMLGLPPPMGWIYVAIGVASIIMAIWMFFLSTPKSLIVIGPVLLTIGIVLVINVFLDLYLSVNHGTKKPESTIFILWFITLIAHGLRCIGSCKRFSGLSKSKPSKELLKKIKELVKTVETENSVNTMEFQNKLGQVVWKGMFFDEFAVFVERTNVVDVIIEKKENIEMTKMQETSKRKLHVPFLRTGDQPPAGMDPELYVFFVKKYDALLRIGDHTINTKTTQGSFSKLEKWKSIQE